MTKTFLEYGQDLKKVSDQLANGYADAATAYVKAGELDRADELRRELAAYSLPTKLVSIQLLRSKASIMHGDYKGWVKPATNVGEKMNATFEIVNGLAESGFVSIRSVNVPNHYLNHGGFRLLLSPIHDSDAYRKNATFKKIRGLSSPSSVSFESINYPGRIFIACANSNLAGVDSEAIPPDRFRQSRRRIAPLSGCSSSSGDAHSTFEVEFSPLRRLFRSFDYSWLVQPLAPGP